MRPLWVIWENQAKMAPCQEEEDISSIFTTFALYWRKALPIKSLAKDLVGTLTSEHSSISRLCEKNSFANFEHLNIFENSKIVDMFKGIMQLPIKRRGQFLKDDFFKGFQNDFDSAIQDIMERHSGRSLLADQFSNFRKLRERDSEETGPVASISETKESTVVRF